MWLLELLQFLLRSRDSFRISKSAVAKLFPRAIMVFSKISSARSSASSSEGKTFSSPTVRRIPTRWNVLWTGFRTAANSTRQPFRRRSRNSSNAWIPVMSMVDMLCRYIMNTLGDVSIAFSVDWNRSATPKNSGPLMAKTSTPSGTLFLSGMGFRAQMPRPPWKRRYGDPLIRPCGA